MEFRFQTPGEVIFGCGTIKQLPSVVASLGRKVLLCLRGEHLERSGALSRLLADLSGLQMEAVLFHLPDGEPVVGEIQAGIDRARDCGAEAVIAIGGGSCIDTGKAIAGLASNPGEVSEYLEGFGNRILRQLALPFIAVPTTAGTGAEATKNAVIVSAEHQAKKSLRSPLLMPRIALLDPQLTVSMTPPLTAETGMDAVTQLIESYISIKAQPLPQAFAIKGLRLAGQFLQRAYRDGSDLQAREGMLLASLLSGIALANSGLGAAHGIAAALGARLQVPHGRACAMLLPHVMAANRRVCGKALAEIYHALSGESLMDEERAADEAVIYIEKLVEQLNIPKKISIRNASLSDLVQGSRGSSMSGNPRDLTDEEIENIIKKITEKTGLRG